MTLGLGRLPSPCSAAPCASALLSSYVSLGECMTERSGRVNLGLEGTLVMGAMTGYAVSYLTWHYPGYAHVFSPVAGRTSGRPRRCPMGAMHAVICNLPRVNSVAVGIAMMMFGMGLAFYLGKPFIQPGAPQLPAVDFGYWSAIEQVHAALQVNAMFLIGVAAGAGVGVDAEEHALGDGLRLAGESEEAAAAMGYSVDRIRIVATSVGGVLAGIGGSYLSLYYPGSWTEQISSGQGLMAVALVIFARWDPVRCLLASLLFGGVGSLGVALQGQHLASASRRYLWNTAPYMLTLVIMILTLVAGRAMIGAPAELGRVR